MKNRYQNIPEEKKQKLKEYQKEYRNAKAGEFYAQNKEAIKEKSRQRYKKTCHKKKNKIKEYQRKRYQELFQYKKEALKNK